MLSFVKKCLCLPKQLCHFAFLEAMNESFIAAHSVQVLGLSVFWTLAILVVCGGISLSLNLHFLDDLWCGVSFQTQIRNFHLYIFLAEVSVKVFGSFLSWAICLKVIWVFFNIIVLYQICILQIFPPSLWLVFLSFWWFPLQSRDF